MKYRMGKQILVALTLGSLPYLQTKAEDIDLFLGTPTTRGAPNVLLLIDNTGNWTAPFEAEKEALTEVFTSLGSENINVGMMMFTETGGGDSNIDGGYIRAAIRSMSGGNNLLYARMIGGPLDPNSPTDPNDPNYSRTGGFHERDDKSNSGKAGLAMAEAYHYFAGLSTTPPYAGNNKNKADYGVPGTYNTYNTGSCCDDSLDVWALTSAGIGGNALDTKSSTIYNSPVDAADCARNYVVYLSNGPVQDSANDNATANSLLADQGGDTTQLPISGGSADVVADEWAAFMRDSALGITTFTLDINPRTTGQGPGWTNLLKNMADVSNGEYFAVDTTDPNEPAASLNLAFDQIFGKILAENSVFASVALPASSTSESTFINRVYIGQFRPDEDAHPRWLGNLKQYKLGKDVNGVLRLLDASESPVISATSGFIGECTRSFWTPSTSDTYWAFDASQDGQCNTVDISDSNSPDGPVVEKGAQAYVLRSSSSRTVYTCSPTFASCTTLTAFATTNAAITDAMLDANDPTDGDNIINWAIGLNVDEEDDDNFGNNGGVAANEMRPSAHGDVIHTRPVALDYANDPNNPEIVVFYSANDGMLRAINGNRTASIGAVAPGQEFWAFIPPEFYGSLKTLRVNSEVVNLPASGTAAGVGGIPKPYAIDGPITGFQGRLGSVDDQVAIYASTRRSGRAMYAFDVTDPTAPALKWKKGCPNLADDIGCTADPFVPPDPNDATAWANLAQAWAPATVTYTPAYTDGTAAKPMLVMGGGYDGCEDFDGGAGAANHNCVLGTSNGNIIYVLDADTGAILNAFETERSVSGAVTIVPTSDNDPNIIYAYAVDTGGNIYRISGGTAMVPAPISTTDLPSAWIMTKIAALGCGTGDVTSCTANRKFLFAPDVVKIPNTDKLAILVGSGDREKPLRDYGSALGVDNYFFAVIDHPTDASWLDAAAPCTVDVICPGALTAVTLAGGTTPGPRGWRLALASDEQVVTSALTIDNVANFSTHIPVDPNAPSDPNDPLFSACASNLGVATTYNIDFENGEGDTVDILTGGLVPSPVAGKIILDDGEVVPFCIGCGGENSAIGGSVVGSGITWTQPKSRVYWNIQQ